MSRRALATEPEPAPIQDAEAAVIRAQQTQQWADATRAGWAR